MKLNELKLQKSAKIVNINLKNKKYQRRLEELGLYKGAEVKAFYTSPLKKTLLIKIFNNLFAIKTEIAKEIEVIELWTKF